MPRRNRNSGTPLPDAAVLAAELAAELADLATRLGIPARPARAGLPVPYCPRLIHPEVTR